MIIKVIKNRNGLVEPYKDNPKLGVELLTEEEPKPEKGCEGCCSRSHKYYHKHLQSGRFQWTICTPSEDPCPCSLCVVKTMCKSTCEEYREYRAYPG